MRQRVILALALATSVYSSCSAEEVGRERVVRSEVARVGGEVNKRTPIPNMRGVYSDEPIVQVSLAGCDLSRISWAKIFPVANLRYADFRGSNFSDTDVENLLRCDGLQDLGLEYTNITDKAVSKLASLTSLRQLRLNGCGISDECIDDLLSIDSLRSIAIWETNISPQGMQRLREKLYVLIYAPANSEKTRLAIVGLEQANSAVSSRKGERRPLLYKVRLDFPISKQDDVVKNLRTLAEAGELEVSIGSSEVSPAIPRVEALESLVIQFERPDDPSSFDAEELAKLKSATARKITVSERLTPELLQALALAPNLEHLILVEQSITAAAWEAITSAPKLKCLEIVACEFEGLDHFRTSPKQIELKNFYSDLSDEEESKMLEDKIRLLMSPKGD